MDGPGAPLPPIDQNLGLGMHGGATQTRGQIFTEILNFLRLFCIKNYKKLSGGFAPDPHQALDPAEGSAPRPPFSLGLALHALAMVRLLPSP